MKIKTISIYFLLCFVVFASVITTPIQAVMDGVLFAYEDYSKANNGTAPISWSQITQYLYMPAMNSHAGGSAEKSITLINTASFSKTNQDAIFAVTASPISEDRRDGIGRYTLWRKKGAYQVLWQKEEDVKKQLAIQGVAIPQGAINKQPDVKPEITIRDWNGPIQRDKNVKIPANLPPDQVKKITSAASNSSPPSATPASDFPAPRDQGGVATDKWTLTATIALIITGFAGILFWIRSRKYKPQ